MDKDEALKLALEIMYRQGDVGVDEWLAAEAAIKKALATPAQEPVGEVKDLFTQAAWEQLGVSGSTKVYFDTPPEQRPWVGLTEDELYSCMVLKHFKFDPHYTDKDGMVLT